MHTLFVFDGIFLLFNKQFSNLLLKSSSVFGLIFVASWFVNCIFLGVSGLFRGFRTRRRHNNHCSVDIERFGGVESVFILIIIIFVVFFAPLMHPNPG